MFPEAAYRPVNTNNVFSSGAASCSGSTIPSSSALFAENQSAMERLEALRTKNLDLERDKAQLISSHRALLAASQEEAKQREKHMKEEWESEVKKMKEEWVKEKADLMVGSLFSFFLSLYLLFSCFIPFLYPMLSVTSCGTPLVRALSSQPDCG